MYLHHCPTGLVPHVVQDLTTRHHAEVLLPHDDGVGHGTEQSLCARATSTLESMTGVTMVMCELPIEVSVHSAVHGAGRRGGVRSGGVKKIRSVCL